MTTDVTSGFDHAARRYDLMVALNPGYHAHLRAAADELVRRAGSGPLLDLGCGSGASTRALVDAGALEVLGVDASEGMLAQARAKRWPNGVSFVHGRADDAVDLLADGPPPTGALAAYLFRNIPEAERDAAVARVRDALEPGGWLVAQDYAVRPGAPDAVWTAVCWGVVIPMSAVLLRDTSLYRYLWHSGRSFDSPERFMHRLADAGFTDVAVRTTRDWQRGILHTFVARTPEDAPTSRDAR
ncbi:class I SAM-dependent methyltransferase [Mariniluteicoccus endophyticus]